MPFTAEEMKIIQDLNSNTQAITKRLDELERTPAKGAAIDKRAMFQGFDDNPQDWRIDKHRFKHLNGAYSTTLVEQMNLGGKRRVSGIGPALVKMAALSGSKSAMEYARQAGMPSDYDNDKLEAEYGCTTITKALNHGIPGYDLRTRKVLMNERRKTNLAENSGMLGGYTVPPQFQAELQTIAGEDNFVEQRCKQIPMNSLTFELPLLDIMTAQSTGTTPYGGGILFTWQPEAATINPTNPQFRSSTWTAWNLCGVCASSNQLLADNGIGLDALLTQLFGWGISFYKQYAFLQGLGAGNSMPLGVLNAPATILQGRSVPGHFNLADAAAMLSHAQIRSWDTACWVMHQSVIPDLIQMVDNSTSGRLVWVNPFGESGNRGPMAMKLPQAFLNGLPIYFTECVPTLGTTGDVMLIDWGKYVVGNRMDMQIDVSPHVLFQSNQLMWRVITRCDGKPWLQSPITDAQGWTVSPFVCLD